MELELTDGIRPVGGLQAHPDGLRILIRFRDRPIGWVAIEEVAEPILSPERLKEAIAEQIGWELMPSVLGVPDEEAFQPRRQPPISVIVCTRDRTELLARCLDGLLGLDYPEYEIIVVDNAPSTDATARLAAKFPVRYVREDRPGLDRARNAGISQARHEIVAFIDDDARPDRRWLTAFARVFEEPEVMAVTGFVAPLELETQAQIRFEEIYGGMGHGFRPKVLQRTLLTDAQLLWASSFGVGANMAFRREVFRSIGFFDPALDVGTPSGGGGDVEMFHRLVANGSTLVYEPAALVWHQHRRQTAGLRRLIFDNGRSFGGYLLTSMRKETLSRGSILYFAVRHWLWAWLIYRLLKPGRRQPRSLVWIELSGALASPLAYLLAQAGARRLDSTSRAGQRQPSSVTG
jgi:GT2 family glycosyltransferase